MPHPLVKWAHEPARAEDVPLGLAHGAHLASLPPRGPVFVSIPMDDWYAEVEEAEAAARSSARCTAAPCRPRGRARARRAARRRLEPGDGRRARHRRERRLGRAVALAERQRLPVWAAPATGGVRLGFPESHPNFRGVLPPAIGPIGQTLEGHDLILVVGSSVFPYYPHIPGPLLPEGPSSSRSPAIPRRRRGRRWATRSSPTWRSTLEALVEQVPESSRAGPEPNAGPRKSRPTDPLNSSTVHTALGEVLPEDAIIVLESPASTLALRNQLRLSRPGSYYFSAGGGLGFGLAASVGVQLAQPDRPVVCVLGEGSAQYAVSAFWSAGLQGAGDLPRSQQRRVRDPQVVRRRRAGAGRARARPAAPRRRRRRRRLRRRRRRATSATRCAGARGGALLLAAGAGRSPGRSPACPCSDGAGDDRPRRPRPRVARDRDAASRCAASSRRCSAPTACSRGRRHRPLRVRREPYRLLPQAVVMAHDAGDVARTLDYGRRSGIPVVSAPAGRASTARARRTASWSTCAAISAASGRGRTGAGARRAGDGPRARQPGARPVRAQARARPGEHRHRHGRRRGRQQLRRHALWRRPRLLLDRALADLRAPLRDDDRQRRPGRRRAVRRGGAGAGGRPGIDPR